MATINIVGTGGIIEGNLGAANVNVNLDAALSFDGTNDYISIADDNDLDFGNDTFSVSMWIKTTQTTSTNAYLIHKANDDAGSGDKWWGISLDSDEKVHFQVDDGSTAVQVLSSTVINDGSWHHICAIYKESTNLRMYIDGVLETTTAHSSSLDTDTSSVIEIGAPTGRGLGGQYGDYYNQYMGVRGQEFSKGVDPKDMTTFTGFLEDQTKKNPFSDRYRMMTPYQRGVSTSKFAPSTRFIFY